ncbi:MAG: LysR substrate-binding domain-containing protein [Labrys sp. (in: a-proteobacteria)]
MSTTNLRAFHLVATAESFTRAARLANVSQPTLSAQVGALEETHGVTLFDRRGRGVILTPLGHSLFALTTRLFAAEDECMALLRGARTLTRGHLRLAADSATHVMPLLAELRQRNPGLTFSLSIGNSSDVVQQVVDYAAEVGITARQTSDPRLHSVLLRRDTLILFMPRDHAWRDRSRVDIRDLDGADIIVRERGSITREVFETRLAEAGVRPAALIEVQTREAVREAVMAGFGLGVIFGGEFTPEPALLPLAVEGADLSVAEYVICLEDRRRLPIVRGFLDILRERERPVAPSSP